MLLFKLLISVYVAITCADGEKILGVYPLPWGSHYILGTKLLKGLAEAGHEVTMITPFPMKDVPKNWNWTDVVLDGIDDQFKAMMAQTNMLNLGKIDPLEQMKQIAKLMFVIANATLHHPKTKKLVESGVTFDAVILDVFLNDCHHVFGYLFKGHLILASTQGPNILTNDRVGIVMPLATVPIGFIPDRSEAMTFIERFWNLYVALRGYLIKKYYIWPIQEKMIKESFPDAPSFNDLYHNVSLVLLNSHISLNEALPLVPNMIEVGGYHIDPPKKLPKDLQEFLDSAKDGAIFFSLGSTLKSRDMTPEKKKMLLNVFGGLKQKVLWKFEDELDGKPDNVLIKSWMPQQDILAHPNIKLFITHGGLLSMTETVYHGIPVLAIPVGADQEMNADNAVGGGFGLKLHYSDDHFNEETLKSLIEELLHNPKFTENIKRRSKIYHDRQSTPLQTAIYWIEYIIRHKGAPHLRVAGVNLQWYKYYMVDVLAVLFSIILAILFSIRFVLRLVINALTNKSKTKVKKL